MHGWHEALAGEAGLEAGDRVPGAERVHALLSWRVRAARRGPNQARALAPLNASAGAAAAAMSRWPAAAGSKVGQGGCAAIDQSLALETEDICRLVAEALRSRGAARAWQQGHSAQVYVCMWV